MSIRISSVVSLILATLLLSATSIATPPTPIGIPFAITLRPVTEDIEPGPLQLELIAKRLLHDYLDEPLEIKVETYEGLVYDGPNPITPEFDENDSLRLLLNVTIAPDTVNGIRVVVKQGSYLRKSLFIKTFGDSIQITPGFLQERFRGRPVKQPEHILGGWIRGQFPDLDTIYGPIWDSISVAREAYRDSMYKATGAGEPNPDWDIATLTMTETEWQRHQMEQKEDSALSGRAIESYRVGDTMFYRLEGQKQFRRLAEGFSFVPKVVEIKSGRSLDPDQPVAGFIRIQNTEQLQSAQTICDSVFQTVRDSVYFVFVIRRDVKRLFEAGLNLDTDAPKPVPVQLNEESEIPGKESLGWPTLWVGFYYGG